ncbi:MAG TPA: NAD-dependent epimerase/dehydratase family protein [Nitrospira sp.]|nr:NAD-dependent epimerase/dehydratase family protein [Nitrospira sp.]
MATYLVTGGCGFIGSHLCEALIAGGANVRVLDDLSTGSADNVPRGVPITKGDVSVPSAVVAAMDGIDGCFHLAAITSVERSTEEWITTSRTNLSGTIAVFDAARRMGRKGPIPVVYASSAAVYGDCARLPIRETTRARPLSAYGADKYACELHARVAFRVHRVPTVGLRFFNVYGPRQDPLSPYAGVISIFSERLLAGQPINIFGDGAQTRDFVFVADVVAALLAAMEQMPQGASVFNVCTGKSTSVLDLARLIGKLCGSQPDIRFQPLRRGEIMHSRGNDHLLRRHFELPATTELSMGMPKTLAWMQACRVDRGGAPSIVPMS